MHAVLSRRRVYRLRHLGSATVRQLGSRDDSASAKAGLSKQEGLGSKPQAAERGYDAGDPRRQTYHVVISSGAHAVACFGWSPTMQLSDDLAANSMASSDALHR